MNIDSLVQDVIRRCRRESDRKQERSRRTEQQILAAALRVFARDGISRARIADVAAEAGISTSTLYEYHDSKEDIAYAVPLSYLADFYAEFASAIVGRPAATDRILTMLTLSADFARRHPDWARLHYLEIWPSVLVKDSVVGDGIGDFARVLVALVRQGIDEGAWPADVDPHETAAILIGGVNQVIVTWLLYRQPKNLTKAGAAIVQRMLAMVEAEPRRAATVTPLTSAGRRAAGR